MGWGEFPAQKWKWPCDSCDDPRSKAVVELHVVATDGSNLVVKALCRAGHAVACGNCLVSLEYVLADNPPHVEATCRACKAHVKWVDTNGTKTRENIFQPSDNLKQQVRERDKTCRFCNFSVTARLQEAMADPASVPPVSEVTEKAFQRLIAQRARELNDARPPSFFDVSDFAASSESEMSRLFFDLTDLYAEAALRDGQRMMQYDHLVPVKYIRRVAKAFTDDELQFLGQECVVLCCNVCNNIRKEHLEDEAHLLELYLQIFLSRFRRVPPVEWQKFRIFVRAVREVHRRLESDLESQAS